MFPSIVILIHMDFYSLVKKNYSKLNIDNPSLIGIYLLKKDFMHIIGIKMFIL